MIPLVQMYCMEEDEVDEVADDEALLYSGA
jgi:hypothetical protein